LGQWYMNNLGQQHLSTKLIQFSKKDCEFSEGL
jgi:hypothetical protein